MSYLMTRGADYPGTDLPTYDVWDADEYADTSRTPRPIGSVWGVGTAGVTGRYIATAVRWQLAGSGMVEGTLIDRGDLPTPGRYAEAARAMIAAYDAE